MAGLIILVFAFVCAVMAAFRVSWSVAELGWVALALLILAILIGTGGAALGIR